MATLILQDGTVLKGKSFGAPLATEGEIVFNTSMTGYQEILTDPSYAQQIIVMTYSEIGNYGINDFDFESESPSVRGFVVKEYCEVESHYKSAQNISDYLKSKDIVAIEGIDTRSLVKKIRESGTMNAYISSQDLDEEEISSKLKKIQNFKVDENVVSGVTVPEKKYLNPKGQINMAFIDYGAKKGIIDSLIERGCKLTIFPADVEAKEILNGDFDALFLSNGPGNPADCVFQIRQLKELMGKLPIFGICLGYQLLALASGASTYKLKYGHRGANHPIINLENNKVMVTSQNHGYAVDIDKLTNIMRATYKNLNDNTLEGFEISSLKVYAVQFHPEAKPGPNDASIIFDEWINILSKSLKKAEAR